MIVNRLPLIVILNAQQAWLRRDGLRGLIRLEALEQHFLALRRGNVARAALSQHQAIVRLQVFSVYL